MTHLTSVKYRGSRGELGGEEVDAQGGLSNPEVGAYGCATKT